jgi:hypothetical protein
MTIHCTQPGCKHPPKTSSALSRKTKNDLSFALVDQPETKALFTFFSPTTKQISRRTLMKELKARSKLEKPSWKSNWKTISILKISLTTDGWAGNNKLDYIAVTGHWQTKLGSVLLDIIELTNMIEVTNQLGITCAVMSSSLLSTILDINLPCLVICLRLKVVLIIPVGLSVILLGFLSFTCVARSLRLKWSCFLRKLIAWV